MWCPEGMSYHAVVTAPTHVQDLVCLILLFQQFQTPAMNNTLVFCVEAPAKFPCVEQYHFFHCIGNMQNLLDMKRLGSQGGPG